ncbi:ABC transporter permease [Staphylothermus hellenicus]|uniref:ABC3 transporter permease protein domain-containing protein n=1 Tax=Staphylothermus hellenicus (strain DSM 12710 / JCM 10830 / BK20S6-10-b1 / P8) TaxID=591019 RepID=D7D8L8_STAHD|nr:ABC transporter permease [Staphylothermus hellenicus]ADI32114.1 protein of unknown function DUF214 [Staphylothermus hellenicus DSM 12710]
MFISDIIRLAIKTLSEKKVRAVLTIIGIAIGPLALITINSVTSGYSRYIVQQIQGFGQNLVVVMSTDEYTVTEDDLEFLKTINGVVDASPFYSTQGTMRIGGKEEEVFIYAVNYDFLFKAIPSLKISMGEIPSPTEISKCIVGHDIAYNDEGREVYGLGDVISVKVVKVKSGGELEIKHVSLAISAILEKYGGAALLNPDKTIFISMNGAEKLLGVKKWSGILLYVKDPSMINNVTNTIRNIYGRSVDVISFLAFAQIASSISSAVGFMTFSASLAAFAVAIAGVAATMITSVIERTREIGVMKALGFTDGQVLVLIIAEGIVMSLIGAVIGISIGVVGAYAMASRGLVISSGTSEIIISARPDINVFNVSLTILLTIMVGIVGSIFPAYRAAKIPPAVALRYE